jgi:TolA-binding protein
MAAWLAGCTAPRLLESREELLPEIDIVRLQDDAAAALAAAREARAEASALAKRVAELERHRGGGTQPAAGDAGVLAAKLGELEERVRLLAEAYKELQAQVAAIGTTGGAVGQRQSAAAESDSALYRAALALFSSRDYRGAMQRLELVLQHSPKGSYAERCYYWTGECHYALEEYDGAIGAFEKALAFGGAKADDACLKIGLCRLKTGSRLRARDQFEKLIRDYPSSEYVPRAREYLGQLR